MLPTCSLKKRKSPDIATTASLVDAIDITPLPAKRHKSGENRHVVYLWTTTEDPCVKGYVVAHETLEASRAFWAWLFTPRPVPHMDVTLFRISLIDYLTKDELELPTTSDEERGLWAEFESQGGRTFAGDWTPIKAQPGSSGFDANFPQIVWEFAPQHRVCPCGKSSCATAVLPGGV